MAQRWWWIIAAVILALSLVGMSQLVGGSAPPEEGLSWEEDHNEVEVVKKPEPKTEPVTVESKLNYFRIVRRDDVEEPNQFKVWFEHGVPDDWPGAYFSKTRMRLIIRGIDVPMSTPDENDPYGKRKLQLDRNTAGRDFVWEILSRTTYLWALNPELDYDREATVVDVFYQRGDAIINMAAALVQQSHAIPVNDGMEYDWGYEVPKIR